MNKRLYKFITIGSAAAAVVSPIAIVVSCGSSNKASTNVSPNFDTREVRTYEQWIKDFPQFKDVIVNNKLVDNAFVDVVKLANNKLPDNFYLPDAVNEIGVGAFRGIEINKGFEFPFATQVINKYAFQKAILPEGFTIPKKLRTISSYAFADIVFPNKFSFDLFSTQYVVSDTAFYNAKFAAGAKVTLTTFLGMKSRGATSFDFVAKDGRNNLDGNIIDWSFPVKLTIVPASAFANAVLPDDFQFPFWLTGIGANAFYNAKLPVNFKISLVSSGNGLAKIESNAFQEATLAQGFQIIAENGNAPQVDGTAFYGAKVDPSITVNRTTYDLLIQGGINTLGIVLNESQTRVDDFNTTVENGHIKSYAYAGIDFTKTDASTQKVLADLKTGGYTAIDNSAFYGAKFPDGFTIPSSVTSIAYKAFANADFLGDLTVPNTVKTMEPSVFDNALGTKMIFNAGVTTVPEGTFSVNEGNSASSSDPANTILRGFLGGITFGNDAMSSITAIGKNAFNHVSLKAGFVLPTSLKVLETGAFTNVHFDEKLTVNITDAILGTEVFANAEFKNGIDMSSTTIKTMANGVFANAIVPATANIQLPTTINAIPKATFNGVVLPTAFSLPTSVISIGASAFDQAILNASFTLGHLTNLKEIGVAAFRGKGNDIDKTNGNPIVVRKAIPAGFTVPASLKTIRSEAFAYTDWSQNTSAGFKGLTANFKYSKDALDGLIEPGALKGVILNDAFELPTTMDIIPSEMFQNAIFRNKDAKIVTESFPRMTVIGPSAFEEAQLAFNLNGMTLLKTIGTKAFRGTNILSIPSATEPDKPSSNITISEFRIPATVTSIDKDAFFGTYTLVSGTDWEGKTVNVKRTVDWFIDVNGVPTKAEEDNGNPKIGSYAKASENEYIPEFSAGPGKGAI